MTKVTKESINYVVNNIAFVVNHGGAPIFGNIINNFNKGYKPAKDFVNNLARMVCNGELPTDIDVVKYLSNLTAREIVPYSYSKYPKVKE